MSLLTQKIRKIAIGLCALALAGSLMVGCTKDKNGGSGSASESASATDSSSNSDKPAPASNTDSITVSGGFGEKPTVSGQWPFTIDKTQTRVLVAGEGEKVPENAIVKVNYSGVNARTGETFDTSFDSGPRELPLTGVIPGFKKGLIGQQVGSRVLVAITNEDGYAQGNKQAKIEVGDTLLFVIDIVDSSLAGPKGETVSQPAGQPVVTDSNGVPEVKIDTSLAAPTELVVQPLIKGNGTPVTAQSAIMANYVVYDYATGQKKGSTYEDSPQMAVLSGLIEGWKQGLVGQTVGSRVMLIVPSALAYPDGSTQLNIAPGSTLVFVIDLLYAGSGAA